nr:hypothetical protein CFP56_33509 [Quercus suber]
MAAEQRGEMALLLVSCERERADVYRWRCNRAVGLASRANDDEQTGRTGGKQAATNEQGRKWWTSISCLLPAVCTSSSAHLASSCEPHVASPFPPLQMNCGEARLLANGTPARPPPARHLQPRLANE